jgi:hypothetical protein
MSEIDVAARKGFSPAITPAIRGAFDRRASLDKVKAALDGYAADAASGTGPSAISRSRPGLKFVELTTSF